jgi:hypothetical protein
MTSFPSPIRPLLLASCACLALVSAPTRAADPSGAAPIDLGSRLEPFVDRYLIESTKGVDLALHEPRPAGTALVFDKPWEGVTSAYVTVLQDGDHYRMYYRGSSDQGYTLMSKLLPGETVVPPHPNFICMAESKDGIAWTRPSLGQIAFNGSTDNNIVWTGKDCDNFSPFKDDNPRAPDSERYKAVGSGVVDNKAVLFGFVSPDGRHWRKAGTKPIMTDGKFDSLNVVFWDNARQQYTAIYRDFHFGVRAIKYSSSSDFLNWAPGQWCDFGAAPAEHLYTTATVPYFRAPHIYFAMPRRFLPWKTYFPEMEAQLPGISDGVFMSSRDGVHWNRFEEAFIRPGLGERNWVHRANTPVRGMVPTSPEEISLYVERNYTFPTDLVERMTVRTDGFVSAHAGAKEGELITKPLTFTGADLVLNFSTSAIGSVRVEIQDASGKPLPGFALEDSPLLFGDSIEHTVAWAHTETPKPLSRLKGLPIRLRFVMRDADLYSVRFK